MGLDFFSMSVFWTWYAFQPVTAPVAAVQVVPTKVIIQATWVEPASLRDETTKPTLRQPAKLRPVSRVTSSKPAAIQKPQKPLWKAAKSWEIPPILWAGFEGFLAAGLGVISLLKS